MLCASANSKYPWPSLFVGVYECMFCVPASFSTLPYTPYVCFLLEHITSFTKLVSNVNERAWYAYVKAVYHCVRRIFGIPLQCCCCCCYNFFWRITSNLGARTVDKSFFTGNTPIEALLKYVFVWMSVCVCVSL